MIRLLFALLLLVKCPSTTTSMPLTASVMNDLPEMPQCTDIKTMVSEVKFMARGADQHHQEQRVNATNRTTRNWDDEMARQMASRQNLTFYIQGLTMSLNQTYCMVSESNDPADYVDSPPPSITPSPSQTTAATEQQRRTTVATMLHIIDYVGLEHHYPIANAYQFGIPEITQKCRCDCAGGQQLACRIEDYHYKNCSNPKAAICYRTYRSGQQNTGCPTSGKAELCCDIHLNPHREWLFQAIRLRQPSTVVVLRYRILERTPSRRSWTKTVDQSIKIALNKGATTLELTNLNRDPRSDHRLQITAVGNRPHRQVEPGLYFFKTMSSDTVDSGAGKRLRTGVPLNDQIEGDLEKLGWFRWDKIAGWTVKKGLEKITQAQHVSVDDCMAQHYSSTFNAEQLVLRGNGEGADELDNFYLGTLVKDEPWVEDVEVHDRFVRIEHSEGVALMLNLVIDSKPQIVHQISHFANFSGTIQLDSKSNRYLNLTFQNARGTLIGQVYSSPDSTSNVEVVFSVEVAKQTQREFRTLVAVPSSINSPKLVCVHPAGDLDGKTCHRLDYIYERLTNYQVVSSRWQQGSTECAGCNERGVDGILTALDPRNWLDGLNSPTEVFTCILEIAVCTAILLLSVIVVAKCIFPLFKCVFSIIKPPKNKLSR